MGSKKKSLSFIKDQVFQTKAINQMFNIDSASIVW